MMTALFAFLLGVLTMPDTAVAADPKEKEFPPLPKGDLTFPEKVTVKRWSAEGKKFITTTENVSAQRFSPKGNGVKHFYLKTKDIGGVAIAPGSEVVDEDGNMYTVVKSPQTAADVLVQVKLKP